MSDMSHTMRISADLAKVKQAASNLKASPPTMAAIEQDPQKFLQQMGIEVDDQTAGLIKNRLAKRAPGAAQQASAIHVDI